MARPLRRVRTKGKGCRVGQYHLVVNLSRKEFLDPHKLGCGLKAWEQIANPGLVLGASTPHQENQPPALRALTRVSREIRHWALHHRSDKSLTELAQMYNPCIRGALLRRNARAHNGLGSGTRPHLSHRLR